MTSTIAATNGAGTTNPDLILGYEATRESRNRVHDLIDGGIAVAIIPPRPRTGELRLFYPAEADAWASLALHSEPTSFTLVDTDRGPIGMTYTLADGGQLRIALDDQTRDVWVVTVPFQEVEP